MTVNQLAKQLQKHPAARARFVLPDSNRIPAHVHLSEVSHVFRKYIDCGGVTGTEEKVVLQTHVGDDIDHRLTSDHFAKILQLGKRVIPHRDLEAAVEYDCCVVAQYPIGRVESEGEHVNIILERGRTQCRARDRRQAAESAPACCAPAASCC
jgi:hypothetical protein